MTVVLYLIIACGALSIAYGVYTTRAVLAADPGTARMQEIAAAIQEGAQAYLARQYQAIAVVGVVIFIILAYLLGMAPAIGFAVGAVLSGLAGYIGMNVSVRANVRTAQAATKSLADGLSLAFRAGAVTGLLVAGLALLSVSVYFLMLTLILGYSPASRDVVDALVALGFGASLISIFARLGGGIFTKGADVGGDLVGKVEAGIPEDDPRNPATIADNVGDNVGDCAGMAADIFESYEVTIVSGLILGLALTSVTGHIEWIIYPLLVRGIGVLSSIIGTYLVRAGPGKSGDAMKAIFTGFLSSAAISVVLFGLVGYVYMQNVPGGWWRPFLATAVGVLLAILIDRLTEYFTGTHAGPVRGIKKAADTGPATLILSGISVGYESSVWSILVIAVTISASIAIFGGVDPAASAVYILYGVAMAGIGMLTLTGNNVAMDSYGPISDNANGIGQLSWHGLQDEDTRQARQIMADLDGVGNTTKAITKGVAIGSAVIAAVSLFGSYLVDVSRAQAAAGIPLAERISTLGIRIEVPQVFVGMLIGGALPWLFSSFAINAVSRAASLIVQEVRRQFRLGVLEGKVPPDYQKAVEISTQAAQKELISLALLGVITPIVVGLVLQVEALGGFLAGIILSGQLLAVFMNNAGGAWDNAKKIIEDETSDPAANTGKGSERHKASVVGDTVGDPMKDTAGPALNPMIKVVNLVSVIIAPVVVQYRTLGAVGWIIVVGLMALLGWAIWQSKRTAPVRTSA